MPTPSHRPTLAERRREDTHPCALATSLNSGVPADFPPPLSTADRRLPPPPPPPRAAAPILRCAIGALPPPSCHPPASRASLLTDASRAPLLRRAASKLSRPRRNEP
ncbi:hypothetical protein PVAP13_6NG106103 [Panicum virgatum]|uniref:Uncharacterized protein n=1 Tax=Panicum virgatum TaxID=38727 RepID=A0A8T0QVT9_PANVG|nr:hypothetical protein PVAP13_6NG106103 [Panicum virgatum]